MQAPELSMLMICPVLVPSSTISMRQQASLSSPPG
jgi:hypothetical protein